MLFLNNANLPFHPRKEDVLCTLHVCTIRKCECKIRFTMYFDEKQTLIQLL
jgi:hypothetical protein